MRPTGLPLPLPVSLGVPATSPIGHVQTQGQTHGAPGATSLPPEMMGSNNNSTLGVSGLPLSSSRSPPPPGPSAIPMSYPVNANANAKYHSGYEYDQYPYPSHQYSGVHQQQQQQYGVQGYTGSVIPTSAPGSGPGPGSQLQGNSSKGTGPEFSDGRNTIPFPGTINPQFQVQSQSDLVSGPSSRSHYPVDPNLNGNTHSSSVSSYVPLEPSGVPLSGPAPGHGPGLDTSNGIGIAPRARSHPHPHSQAHPYPQPSKSSQTQNHTQTSISPQVHVPNQSQDLPQSSGGGQKRGRVQSRGGSVVSVASSGSRGSGLGAGVDVPRVGGVRCCTFVSRLFL